VTGGAESPIFRVAPNDPAYLRPAARRPRTLLSRRPPPLYTVAPPPTASMHCYPAATVPQLLVWAPAPVEDSMECECRTRGSVV